MFKENNEVIEEEILESEEEVEVAEPLDEVIDEGESETEISTEEESEAEVEEAPRNRERDAMFAEARREYERKQKATDERFAKLFKGSVNPTTGKEITSMEEYLEAYEEQERLKELEQFKTNGVTEEMLERYISNSPQMRELAQLRAQMEERAIRERVEADVKALSEIDSSITKLEDVPEEILKICSEKNLNLVDAYKIANFGKSSKAKAEATVQRAVNQAKAKSHLSPVNGVSTAVQGVDIPSGEYDLWRSIFPDKTDEELRIAYNNGLTK